MNYLSIENLTKSYGEKLLFENISFGIDAGQKIALIAKNGSGKTTLLNIISGKDFPDNGSVVLRKNLKMAYLSQQPDFDDNLTIFDAILSSDTRYVKAVRNYEYAIANTNANDSEKILQNAIIEMDAAAAWDFEYRVKEVLGKLKIVHVDTQIDKLSGGQKRKVALAKVLLDDIDFLVMDEPTNHLDIDMIEWMEGFLGKQNLTILVVTHDRYFLNNLCDEIIELDNQNIYHYQGKYDYYIEKKAERENTERQEVLKARNLYRKELDWIRRMPKARTHKSKSRIDAFDGVSEKASRNIEEERVEIKVKSGRIGNKILEINNLHKSFGKHEVIKNFSHTFKRGEKIGVVGPNGSGKSTFFKLILDEIKPTLGSINRGQTIVYGYFSQDALMPDIDKKVIDMVKEVADEIPIGQSSSLSASGFLTYFGFDHNTQYNFYRNLSGGEKRRLQLLLSLVNNPNFLIFDEPTNDLDINTLNILEEFLSNYEGCLLIATHDRAFIDKIVDHIFVFEGDGRIKDYHSTYTEYREKINQLKKLEAKNKAKEKTEISKTSIQNKKPSFKQIKELEALVEQIEKLELEKEAILKILEGGSIDAEVITKASENYSKVSKLLDDVTERWIELEDIVEGLKS